MILFARIFFRTNRSLITEGFSLIARIFIYQWFQLLLQLRERAIALAISTARTLINSLNDLIVRLWLNSGEAHA